MKRRISVYLESSLLEQLEKVATRQKLTKSVSSSPRSLRFSPPTLPIDSRLPSRDVSIVLPASPNVLSITWLLLPRRLLSSSGSGSPPRRRHPQALIRRPKPKAESDTEPSSRPSVGDSRRAIVSFKKYRKMLGRNKVAIRDRRQTDCDPSAACGDFARKPCQGKERGSAVAGVTSLRSSVRNLPFPYISL